MRTVLVRAGGAAFFLAMSLVSASQSQKEAGSRIFTAVDRASTASIVDVGDPGDSVGDIRTSHDLLYDGTGKLMGRTLSDCTRVRPNKGAWVCLWTIQILGKGSLTLEGPLLDSRNSVLAVTGGTGAFLSARGQVLLRQTSSSRWNLRFQLVPS
jgi:allene oxide cyclase